ncbi:winged helix-turn-helix transcriptional regulator [Gordonia sp. SL306]|uniref:winged helix-turn-helix transcriptional regulator n=1 Tax=Gordonia sp. SL306 TaxID=2995145 RepID=UPI00226DC5E6|nr:helix-turn-helix domain-containing protein [Gordonia sp. SL306]WAC56215.1 helix-turn-helix domain-containing protein [Gordonia sp. SL306]
MADDERLCSIRGDLGQAVRGLLDRIADKWALLIIATLHDRQLRFTEVQRLIPGISQRMLSLTLRKLERDGLVARTAYAEVPPRVEYRLTDLADSLLPHAIALANWAAEHNDTIGTNRREYDARRDEEAASRRRRRMP